MSFYDESPVPSENGENYFPKTLTKLETTKVMKCSLIKWNYVMLALNFIAMSLISGSIVSPRWVEQGDEEHFWRGGVLKCSGCNGEFSNKYYSEIKSIACNDLKGYCKTFSDLYMGGILMILGSLIFFCLFFCWFVFIILENSGREFNKKFFGIFVIGGPLCLAIGCITWHIIVGADYKSECYNHNTTIHKSAKLCAIDGPIVMLAGLFISSISSIIYYVLKLYPKPVDAKILPYMISDES